MIKTGVRCRLWAADETARQCDIAIPCDYLSSCLSLGSPFFRIIFSLNTGSTVIEMDV
jgi:hypothetical protein